MLSEKDFNAFRSFIEQSSIIKRPVTVDFIHGRWSVSTWGPDEPMVETNGRKKQSLNSVIRKHRSDLVFCKLGG